MQAILDQISKMSQDKSKMSGEADPLRLMAEAVQNELANENLIRSLDEANQASAASELLERATSSEEKATATATAPEADPAARSNSSAYEAQKQAYRENA